MGSTRSAGTFETVFAALAALFAAIRFVVGGAQPANLLVACAVVATATALLVTQMFGLPALDDEQSVDC